MVASFGLGLGSTTVNHYLALFAYDAKSVTYLLKKLFLHCVAVVLRNAIGTAESSHEHEGISAGPVAQSVFRDLIIRASFGRINDLVCPVIRYVLLQLKINNINRSSAKRCDRWTMFPRSHSLFYLLHNQHI